MADLNGEFPPLSLMIVGAQKAGTTALKDLLSSHFEVLGHPQAEFAYFSDLATYTEDAPAVFKRHFTIGDKSTSKVMIAKNANLYYDPDALSRLQQFNPSCKIVFIIRNPVDRAISSYRMEKFNGWMKSEVNVLREGLNDDEGETNARKFFINLGDYLPHYMNMLEHFDRDNIIVIRYEDFKSKPQEVSQSLFSMIGVDHSIKLDTSIRSNVTTKSRSKTASSFLTWLKSERNIFKITVRKIVPYGFYTRIGQALTNANRSTESLESVPEEIKAALHSYFHDKNIQLGQELGMDLSDWNIYR